MPPLNTVTNEPFWYQFVAKLFDHVTKTFFTSWTLFVFFVTDWLEMSGSLILLLVVSPHFFAHTLREHWAGVAICLAIGCYLLQEHVRATGGFRNSFTQSHGISNTIGIILLLVFPIWTLLTLVVVWFCVEFACRRMKTTSWELLSHAAFSLYILFLLPRHAQVYV